MYACLLVWGITRHADNLEFRMTNIEASQAQRLLDGLMQELRALDEMIVEITGSVLTADSVSIQRMKNRRVVLREQVSQLESMLIPNLDA